VTEREYLQKLDGADRLLNDPATAMDPARIWVLLADVAWSSASVIAAPGSGAGRSPAHDGSDFSHTPIGHGRGDFLRWLPGL